MGYIKKFTSLFVLFILIKTLAFSQQVHPDSTIIENEHFSFGIGFTAMQPRIANTDAPIYGDAKGLPAPGAHASFLYLVKMGRSSAVEAGLKVGVQGWRYRLSATPEQHPDLTQSIDLTNSTYTLTSEIPLRVIGRQLVSKDLLWFGFGGLSLNFFKSSTDSITMNNPQFQVFSIVDSVHGNNPYLDLQLGFGIIRRTLGYPIKFSFNAGIPLERREVFESHLSIKDPTGARRGRFHLKNRGFYFGLDISYVLPLRNRWETDYPEY